MSKLVYKQRHYSRFDKKTPKNNYFFIRYIATRDGVVANKSGENGLFGNINNKFEEFDDWKKVAALVRNNSKKKITLFKGVISFRQEDADNILKLKNLEDWQDIIRQNIDIIAKENNIDPKNLKWVASWHNEEGHPHLHIAFWNDNIKEQTNFVQFEKINSIRKKMLKNVFNEYLQELYYKKQELNKGIRNSIFDDFIKNKKDYKELYKIYKNLNIPESGALKFAYLSNEQKKEIMDFVKKLKKEVNEIDDLYNEFVEIEQEITKTYTTNEEVLKKNKKKSEDNLDKMIANALLKNYKYNNDNQLSDLESSINFIIKVLKILNDKSYNNLSNHKSHHELSDKEKRELKNKKLDRDNNFDR